MKKKPRKQKKKRLIIGVIMAAIAGLFFIFLIYEAFSIVGNVNNKNDLLEKYDYLRDVTVARDYIRALDLIEEIKIDLEDETDPELVSMLESVEKIENFVHDKIGPDKVKADEKKESKNGLEAEAIGEVDISNPGVMAFSPDGSELYVVESKYETAEVHIIDVDGEKEKDSFETTRLSWINVNSDGDLLTGVVHCDEAPGYGSPRAMAYEIPEGKEVLNLVSGSGDPSFLTGGVSSQDGRYIFAGTKGTNILYKFDVETGKTDNFSFDFAPFFDRNKNQYFNNVPWSGGDISKDGSRVYLLVRTQTDSTDHVVIMDADDWKLIDYWTIGRSTADAGLVLSPDEESVYVVQNDGWMKKVDLETGRIKNIYDVEAWQAVQAGESQYLVTNNGQIIDTETDEVAGDLGVEGGFVAASLDGVVAISKTGEGMVYLFEVK